MRWRNSLSFKCLPEQGIGLMRICDFHAVNLDEYEIIEFLGHDGGVKLSNNLADCGCFSGTWCARDIDTCSSAFNNGCFKVGVDRGEFIFPAWKTVGYRGDMEPGAGSLKGGRIDVVMVQESSSQWCKLQWSLDDNPK